MCFSFRFFKTKISAEEIAIKTIWCTEGEGHLFCETHNTRHNEVYRMIQGYSASNSVESIKVFPSVLIK